MITDNLLKLMTAAVDGELSPAEARSLQAALAASPDARAAFARLKADRGRLQALPRVPPPADLQQRIMARIAAVTPVPVRRPRSEPAAAPFAAHRPDLKPNSRRWVPVAVAACLLIGVTASSFLFFNQQNGSATARNGNRPPPATIKGAADPAWAKWLPADNGPPASIPIPRERLLVPDAGHVATRPGAIPDGPIVEPEGVELAPQPRTMRSDLHAAAPLPETHFDIVEARLPFLKSLSELDREATRQLLADELGAADPPAPFRIDLFARNPARAVQLFRDAAAAAKVTVMADATTLAQLQKRAVGSVVVYTESLTAAELADLFGGLCAEDAKVSPRVFDALHAVPVAREDNQLLRDVLGIDPGLFKRQFRDKADPTKPVGSSSSKPISAGTAEHIVKSVSGKAGDKSAVLLTATPPIARTAVASSAELRQFIAKRTERNPNAVPVMIVIRFGS